jgi:hypothetical protein
MWQRSRYSKVGPSGVPSSVCAVTASELSVGEPALSAGAAAPVPGAVITVLSELLDFPPLKLQAASIIREKAARIPAKKNLIFLIFLLLFYITHF